MSKPGSKFLYSNLGYIIAAAVVERTTGKPWEKVIAEEVFQPLKMTSADFGGTGTPGKIDQPWPHTQDGAPTGENGPAMDNPPVMGSAGRIHCTWDPTRTPETVHYQADGILYGLRQPGRVRPGNCCAVVAAPYSGTI